MDGWTGGRVDGWTGGRMGTGRLLTARHDHATRRSRFTSPSVVTIRVLTSSIKYYTVASLWPGHVSG